MDAELFALHGLVRREEGGAFWGRVFQPTEAFGGVRHGVKSVPIAVASRFLFEKIEYATPQGASLQVLTLDGLIGGQGRLQSSRLSVLLP